MDGVEASFADAIMLLRLFLAFSVLVTNPKKNCQVLYTVANPARDQLKREKGTKRKSGSVPLPHAARLFG